MLTAFDYGALAILLLSALQGMWRGLLAELLALIGWIAAFLIAAHFAHAFSQYLPAHLPGGELARQTVSFVAIVVLVLVGVGVFGALLGKLTEVIGLRSVDRTLGMLFGLIRGVVLVLVVVALAGFTSLPEQDFWRNAQLLPYAEAGVHYAKQFLPAGLAQYVRERPLAVPGYKSDAKPGNRHNARPDMSPEVSPEVSPEASPGNPLDEPRKPDAPRGNSAVGKITHI